MSDEPDEVIDYRFSPERELIRFTFGELESRLARLHEISSEKRTQFQARLRNFQRLGIPRGVGGGRGKTVHYNPGHMLELALALELTQLGLLPERIIKVFNSNKMPISMCVKIAARELIEKGGFRPKSERFDENMTILHGGLMREGTEEADPLSMFLYFDPTALAPLTDIPEKYEDQASATFFYGGAGIVRENIVKWTAGPFIRRLSFINVTAMLWELVIRSKPERQQKFLGQILEWADALELTYFIETVPEEGIEPDLLVIETPEDIVKHAEILKNLKGVPRPVAEAMIARGIRIGESGKIPGPDAGLTGKPLKEMSESEFKEEMVGHLVLGGLPEFVAREAMDRRPMAAKVQAPKKTSKRKAKNGDGN